MIFKKFEFLIAWRYLKSKRKDGFISLISWLSLIGISLGVAVLIIVMSVMNGFREEMLSKILGLNGHIIISSSVYKSGIANHKDLIKKIANAKIEGVSAILPQIEAQVMVSSDNISQGAMLRGIDFADIAKLTPLKKDLDIYDERGIAADDVIVGTGLLLKLGIWSGDDLTLTTARGNITAFGTIPRVLSYKVGASFNTGMSIYDTSFIFMNMPEAQGFLDMDGKVSYIEIFLNNPDAATDIAPKIRNILKNNNYRITTWEEQNASFVSALKVERNVMFIILTLIILVASFNIVSSLVMLVNDKSFDIAILRTLGARRNNIMKIFFLEGSFIGLIGTICGSILGIWVSNNIEYVRQIFQSLTGTKLFPDDVYFLSELPSKIEYNEVAIVVGISLLISFLATLYPARKAARQEPIETLRYE